MTKLKRIKEAVAVALQYGMIDGAHHKQWVIDQMVRVLLDEEYQRTIEEFNSNEEYEPWDRGIAP